MTQQANQKANENDTKKKMEQKVRFTVGTL
jgi:hypothetical protein